MSTPVTTWATSTFADGFFEPTGALRPVHRRESALGLAYAVIPSNVTAGELRAFALAVREIADQGTGKQPLSPSQANLLQALAREEAMPRPFREVLEGALPAIKTRDDLGAFYGVVAGAEQAYEAIRTTLEGLPETAP